MSHIRMASEANHWSELGQVDELVSLLASVDLKDLQLARLRESCNLRGGFLGWSFSDESCALFDLLQV